MSDFRTKVPLQAQFPELNYNSKILSIGSCFAENIGNLLDRAKFDLTINPNGIIYNPASIAHSIDRLLKNQKYEKEELFYHNDLWHSFAHHSSFSTPDLNQTLENINKTYSNTFRHLQSYTHLFLTFGTAYVYQYKSSGKVVANCHKISNTEFYKKRLGVDQIVAVTSETLNRLKEHNPEINIILAVSPVRHLKDGLHNNNLSKAALLLATERLCELVPDTFYFPSYEIMMDELRGYRFYAEDMTHPSITAVNYIWNQFQKISMTEPTLERLQQIMKIVHSAEHRAFHPDSPAHQSFVRKQLQMISKMEKEDDRINWETEKVIFQRQLAG